MKKSLSLGQVQDLAYRYHGGQLYGDKPYKYHLDAVDHVAVQFGLNFGGQRDHLVIRKAIAIHDVIEDVKTVTAGHLLAAGVDYRAVCVAILVSDLPRLEGETRKECKARGYPIIASDWKAVAVKLCDRIANVREGGKLEMYREEYPAFKSILGPVVAPYDHQPYMRRMWKELDALLDYQS